jgi:hypothetical protein
MSGWSSAPQALGGRRPQASERRRTQHRSTPDAGTEAFSRRETPAADNRSRPIRSQGTRDGEAVHRRRAALARQEGRLRRSSVPGRGERTSTMRVSAFVTTAPTSLGSIVALRTTALGRQARRLEQHRSLTASRGSDTCARWSDWRALHGGLIERIASIKQAESFEKSVEPRRRQPLSPGVAGGSQSPPSPLAVQRIPSGQLAAGCASRCHAESE